MLKGTDISIFGDFSGTGLVTTEMVSKGVGGQLDASGLVSSHPVFIMGLAGDDAILGGSGPLTAFGNAGDDSITGGYGNDILSGGDSNCDLIGFSPKRIAALAGALELVADVERQLPPSFSYCQAVSGASK